MEKESGGDPDGDDVRTAGLGSPPDEESIASLPWLNE